MAVSKCVSINTPNSSSSRAAVLSEASELLSARLGLRDLVEQQPVGGALSPSSETKDVRWWHIPPAHLGDWCCNRHGTLHGGLCLALLFAFCKAHVGLRCGSGGTVTRVHTQYMSPVSTVSPLMVRTALTDVSDDAVRTTAEVYSHKQYQLGRAAAPLCAASITIMRRPAYHSHM
ncbi:hypothetical protein DQ04_00461110 [Trypanosoma grayi]|uniref:hypothetical protein n=1 Tax=Trypanosoma grayi TaxID=71804 RepID=UPI0004F4121B|nr:hypothetical protein DQ04_00461110 [Trypanosoma grayi]KEG14457.1 hypothetical protein DQ04_00461110 [Trypanosoma grayi]